MVDYIDSNYEDDTVEHSYRYNDFDISTSNDEDDSDGETSAKTIDYVIESEVVVARSEHHGEGGLKKIVKNDTFRNHGQGIHNT